jgi:hypothetical protein
MAGIRSNLASILSALREAAGLNVPIVAMNYYKPLVVFWFNDPGYATAINDLSERQSRTPGARLGRPVRHGVVPEPRGVPPQRERPPPDCACLAVNGVGKRCAGEPHAPLIGGWQRGSHSEPARCTCREPVGLSPVAYR